MSKEDGKPERSFGPDIKDVDSAVDSFKKAQGWVDNPVVKKVKKDKPSTLKQRLKKDRENFNAKLSPKVSPMKVHGHKPKKPKHVSNDSTESASNAWALRNQEWEEVAFEEDLYPLTKAEAARRKKEQEYLRKKEDRDSAVRDQEIYNALIKTMNRELYYPLFHGFGWMLIAKLSKLNVNRITNKGGFQPYEQSKEEQICVLTLIKWDGDGPEDGTVAKSIEDLGCATITVLRAQDVKEALKGI